ncbi:TetR/AcrR family transcriptional regulator [Thalassotalea ponticola]|uniref:TetR/AcrR family transcriptional regulator n=1 Tax=Thalassotalea ponticola TaxID=1523392 RepID=UPI0025B52033|nr:TetR/AcrR family transcriptional regulator [Thalassotalea ponticola]MDN3653256.1 TetR/AcrR family transcriptional regulator [Thalassotalea ponticola]
MAKSRERILTAAKSCFTQHGYQATNVSLVSRYADISRVTIHKQFGSKQDLLRAVINEHFDQENALSEVLVERDIDCWSKIHCLLQTWATPLFTDIEQDLIRNELLFAANKYCDDLLFEHRQKNTRYIATVLERALAANHIQLEAVDLSTVQFAELIELNFKGLLRAQNTGAIDTLIERNIGVYRQATLVTNCN